MTDQGPPPQGLERDGGATVGRTGLVASRRAILGAGLALAATACAPASNTTPSNTPASTASAATAPPGSGQKGLLTTSAHQLYTLPEDHQWHGGGIYDTGQLGEDAIPGLDCPEPAGLASLPARGRKAANVATRSSEEGVVELTSLAVSHSSAVSLGTVATPCSKGSLR